MTPHTKASCDCDGKLHPTGVMMMKRDAGFGTYSPHSLALQEQQSAKSAAHPMKNNLSKALSGYNEPQFAVEHFHH